MEQPGLIGDRLLESWHDQRCWREGVSDLPVCLTTPEAAQGVPVRLRQCVRALGIWLSESGEKQLLDAVLPRGGEVDGNPPAHRCSTVVDGVVRFWRDCQALEADRAVPAGCVDVFVDVLDQSAHAIRCAGSVPKLGRGRSRCGPRAERLLQSEVCV